MAAEFIYEQAPFPSCHASTIVEQAPGKFMCAWFGGQDEGAPDVAIWLSSWDGRWSEPVAMTEHPGMPCWNPVLFKTHQGELHLYYKCGPSPSTWSGFIRRSSDGGKTFGPSFIMPAGLLGPIKNKPIQLADGTILAPTSVESFLAWGCWVDRSTDQGRSWSKHGPIVHAEIPEGVIQPTLLTRKDGSLLAMMRATRAIGQVCTSASSDGGQTWTAAVPHADLPNPSSGIDGVTLKDGRQLLVHNPVHVGRTPLVISLSADDGQTWKQAMTLESEPGEYSYPAVIQASDGSIHVTYTWHRERIRHQWFMPEALKG